MIELHSSNNEGGDDVPMVEIFSVDGRVFSIPNRRRPNLALRYLTKSSREGLGLAEAWLGSEMFGVEAWDALLAVEDIEDDTLAKIMTAARSVVFGETITEDGQGNESGRSGKSASTRKKRTTKQEN